MPRPATQATMARPRPERPGLKKIAVGEARPDRPSTARPDRPAAEARPDRPAAAARPRPRP